MENSERALARPTAGASTITANSPAKNRILTMCTAFPDFRLMANTSAKTARRLDSCRASNQALKSKSRARLLGSVKPLFLKDLFFQSEDRSGRGHCPRTMRTAGGRNRVLDRADRPL